MKKVNWNERNCKLVDNSTPFKVIALPENFEARLYWTKGGTYGPHVKVFLYGFGNDDYPKTYTTGGCGEGAALDAVFCELGRKPRGWNGEGDDVPYRYYIGGNYYRVPKKDWLKY